MIRMSTGLMAALLSMPFAHTAVAQTKTVQGEAKSISATVEAINASTRTITLKGPKGNYVDVVAPESPGRGTALVDTLDETLRDAIVIVDHADLEAGRVATVLALDSASDAEEGVGRHYGYGDGADAVLPAWTPP